MSWTFVLEYCILYLVSSRYRACPTFGPFSISNLTSLNINLCLCIRASPISTSLQTESSHAYTQVFCQEETVIPELVRPQPDINSLTRDMLYRISFSSKTFF